MSCSIWSFPLNWIAFGSFMLLGAYVKYRGTFRHFGWLILLSSLIALWGAFNSFCYPIQSLMQPSVDGKVISATTGKGRSLLFCNQRIECSYAVNGKRYKCAQDLDHVDLIWTRIPVGASLRIHYNPHCPSEVGFEWGAAAYPSLIAFMICFFFCVCVGGLFLGKTGAALDRMGVNGNPGNQSFWKVLLFGG